jgi:hypothetical protein
MALRVGIQEGFYSSAEEKTAGEVRRARAASIACF